jgi:hypothetical protein
MSAEPSSRPFARNTGSIIQGTNKIGNLGIGIDGGPIGGYAGTGLQWWNGPSESGGWIIAQEVPANDQPTPVPPSVTASVGFWKSSALTELSFLDLAKYVATIAGSPQTFPSGMAAKTWLNSNGYWTNFRVTGTVTVFNNSSSVVVDNLGFSTDFGSTFTGGIFNVPYVGSLPIGPGQSATLTSNALNPGVGNFMYSCSVGQNPTVTYGNSATTGFGSPPSGINVAFGWNGTGGCCIPSPTLSGTFSWVNLSLSNP